MVEDGCEKNPRDGRFCRYCAAPAIAPVLNLQDQRDFWLLFYLILQWALAATVATTRLWIAICLPFPVAKLSASAIATLSLPVLPLSLASPNPRLLFY